MTRHDVQRGPSGHRTNKRQFPFGQEHQNHKTIRDLTNILTGYFYIGFSVQDHPHNVYFLILYRLFCEFVRWIGGPAGPGPLRKVTYLKLGVFFFIFDDFWRFLMIFDDFSIMEIWDSLL